MPTISVTIITLNEERDLPGCLESVQWADEIIVVDACSTDRTVEIAKQFTLNVHVRPWPGFSEQKNFAAGLATKDWVLHLDADERVTEKLRVEILRVIDSPGTCDGYYVPRLNYWLGRPIYHSGWYPDYALRLFRRGAATCVGMSHETFVVNGSTGRLQNPLLHYTYRTVREHAERAVLSYAPLDAQELIQNGGELIWFLPKSVLRSFLIQIIKGPRDALSFRMLYKRIVKNRMEIAWILPFWPIIRFLDRFVLRQGFRDGAYGFWIAALSSAYEVVRCAILWEHFMLLHSKNVNQITSQKSDTKQSGRA